MTSVISCITEVILTSRVLVKVFQRFSDFASKIWFKALVSSVRPVSQNQSCKGSNLVHLMALKIHAK